MERVTIKVSDGDVGYRLDKFLQRELESLSKILINKYLRKKLILVNGKKVEASYRINLGDEIALANFIFLAKDEEKDRSQPKIDERFKREVCEMIFFEDEHVISLNKPAGVAVQGGTRISKAIDKAMVSIYSNKKIEPRLVHRLDRDTSGLLLFAKSREAAEEMTKLFREREVRKTYHAFVRGKVLKRSGVISNEIDEKEASTEYNVIKPLKSDFSFFEIPSGEDVTLIEFKPKTGRKHQIRIHAVSIGHPIFGDRKYDMEKREKRESNRLALHSYRMRFKLFDEEYELIAKKDLKHEK